MILPPVAPVAEHPVFLKDRKSPRPTIQSEILPEKLDQ